MYNMQIEEIIDNLLKEKYKPFKILKNHRRYFLNHNNILERVEEMSIEEVLIINEFIKLNKNKPEVAKILSKEKYDDFFNYKCALRPGNRDFKHLLIELMTKRGPKYTNNNADYIEFLIDKRNDRGYEFLNVINSRLRFYKLNKLNKLIDNKHI